MSLVIVGAKRRISPYKVVEWGLYALLAAPVVALAVFSMYWTFAWTGVPKTELPWWDAPVFMLGIVSWLATAVGLGYVAVKFTKLAVKFFKWLQSKDDQWRGVSDG